MVSPYMSIPSNIVGFFVEDSYELSWRLRISLREAERSVPFLLIHWFNINSTFLRSGLFHMTSEMK
jgi:hypothetical protein